MNTIAKNTLIQWLRVAITMTATILSTRFALQALGVEAFGVYIVTAGLPLMLAFFNSAMSATTQRMLAAGVNAKHSDRRLIFSASLGPHLAIALLIVLAGETLGLWMFENVLNMPETLRESARVSLRTVVAVMALGAFLAPYEALLRTRECFAPFAVLDVVRSVVILVGSWLLISYAGDRLVAYSILRGAAATGVVVLGAIYAARRFPEGRIQLMHIFNRSDIRERTDLLSWTVFGSLATVMRNQGFIVLANAMYGPVASAALGIGNQLIGVLRQLSNATTQAFTPRIYQLEFAGTRSQMAGVALLACKCGALVGVTLAVPLMIELPTILELWLGSPPPGTSSAITILVIALVLNELSSAIGIAHLAIGRIALYQVFCGSVAIAALPLGYVVASLNGELPDVLMALVVTSSIVAVLRLILLEPHSPGALKLWLQNTIVPLSCSLIASLTVGLAVVSLFEPGLMRVIGTATVSSVTLLSIVYVSLPSQQRTALETAILQRLVLRAAQQ